MKVWAIISSSMDATTSGTARWPRIRRAADRYGRCLRDLGGDSAHLLVQAVRRHHTGDDPVPERLVRSHHPAREHQVRRNPVPADLKEAGDPAGVGDDAVTHLGQHEPRPLGGHPDVTQQGSLERGADRPTLERDHDRCVELEDGADAAVPAAHELVMGHSRVGATEGADVPA